MRVGSVRSGGYDVELSTAQRSPVRIRHCPATVISSDDVLVRRASPVACGVDAKAHPSRQGTVRSRFAG